MDSSDIFRFPDNASTTETDDKQVSDDIEDIDDEEGTDGVSSEGEKPGGNDNIQVKFDGRNAKNLSL